MNINTGTLALVKNIQYLGIFLYSDQKVYLTG